MNREEIYEKINSIARNVFDDEELVLNGNTTANDVENWDSLTHLIFINELELTFEIKFTLGEIQGSKNLDELVNALIKHIENK